MKYRIALVVFVLGSAHAGSALADSKDDLAKYFDDQISSAQKAIASCSVSPSAAVFKPEKIEIGITPTAKFSIDSIVELSISPEIDFTFEN